MSHRRYELTDFEWSIIEPLLPNKPRGVPRVDDRRVLNGIYWRLRTGSPWADIPERYGPYTTCYIRFVRWARLGVWDRIFDAVSAAYEGSEQSVDSSSIRVHQHGANAKRGGAPAGTAGLADLRAVCMGRSRGGRTTMIHAVTDAKGLPITLKLTAGQAHDGRSVDDMFGTLGPGQTLLADASLRQQPPARHLADFGARAVIRPIPRRTDPPPLDREDYRRQNRIERFFSKLKHYRAIGTRYEKHDANFLALVKLAATRIWVRVYVSVS
ncbi:IS5 family transposase [Histidinibacterium lentulum]|uniref:IS5 family transposase n=1 Tax=Histidinibacterium lentulum TaxID=2480588 RepID=UPI003CCC5DB1